jgi:nitrite reductase/ring-hydroxylating ferredoxin subunit
VSGDFFVVDDTCTHGLASLSEGALDGDTLECPWHGGAFNVRTGQPVMKPCIIPIAAYPVVVTDGQVCIAQPESDSVAS